jgi:hypothetical protein
MGWPGVVAHFCLHNLTDWEGRGLSNTRQYQFTDPSNKVQQGRQYQLFDDTQANYRKQHDAGKPTLQGVPFDACAAEMPINIHGHCFTFFAFSAGNQVYPKAACVACTFRL